MANSSGGMPEGVKTAIYWALGIGIIALVLLVMSILFGNLSGNVGFATGTQGYNDTQSVITNYTKSATNVSAQLPTVGTIIGVAILLSVLLGVLIFAIRKMLSVTKESNASFA